jgi:Holliday junction resolvase RusA-like endonuclease
MVTFIIPGTPQGKARARTGYNPRVGKVTSHTPAKTVNYEKLIKLMYINKYGNDKTFHETDALKIRIDAYFQPTKSTSKKLSTKMLSGELLPTKKPDADNIAKIVCDALNDIAYKDDTQICKLEVNKAYSDTERVEVSIDLI